MYLDAHSHWHSKLAKCLVVLLLLCALMPGLSSALAGAVAPMEASASMSHCLGSDADASQAHCGSSTVCEAEPMGAAEPCSPSFMVAWLTCLSLDAPSMGPLNARLEDRRDPPPPWSQRVHAQVQQWLI